MTADDDDDFIARCLKDRALIELVLDTKELAGDLAIVGRNSPPGNYELAVQIISQWAVVTRATGVGPLAARHIYHAAGRNMVSPDADAADMAEAFRREGASADFRGLAALVDLLDIGATEPANRIAMAGELALIADGNISPRLQEVIQRHGGFISKKTDNNPMLTEFICISVELAEYRCAFAGKEPTDVFNVHADLFPPVTLPAKVPSEPKKARAVGVEKRNSDYPSRSTRQRWIAQLPEARRDAARRVGHACRSAEPLPLDIAAAAKRYNETLPNDVMAQIIKFDQGDFLPDLNG